MSHAIFVSICSRASISNLLKIGPISNRNVNVEWYFLNYVLNETCRKNAHVYDRRSITSKHVSNPCARVSKLSPVCIRLNTRVRYTSTPIHCFHVLSIAKLVLHACTRVLIWFKVCIRVNTRLHCTKTPRHFLSTSSTAENKFSGLFTCPEIVAYSSTFQYTFEMYLILYALLHVFSIKKRFQNISSGTWSYTI